MWTSREFLLAATFVFIVSVYAPPVPAAEKPTSRWDLPDRFSLDLGAFFLRRSETEISYKQTLNPVTVGLGINFERNLGLDETPSQPRMDGYYRFTKRQRLDWTWFRIEQTGSRTIDIDIDLPDIDFPPGTTLKTTVDTEVIKLAYTFSFVNTKNVELGIGGGLHITRLDVTLQDVNAADQREQSDFTAPLPVVRGILNYNITPRWRWTNSVDLFFLDYRGYSGTLVDLRSALEHHTFKNVGFGFGFNAFATQLNAEDANADAIAEFDNSFSGVLAYVKVYAGMLK